MIRVEKSCLLPLALGALGVAVAVWPARSLAQDASKKIEIQKCQDADGKWHYGDTAAQECARSKITVIDKRGLKVDEVKAPPTEEELKREEAAAAAKLEEEARAAEEKRARDRILSIYDSEEAILRARDERVGHVDRQIATYADMEGRLRERLEKSRAQGVKPEALQQVEADIDAYKRAIVSAREQRAEIMTRYAQDLEQYRALHAPTQN